MSRTDKVVKNMNFAVISQLLMMIINLVLRKVFIVTLGNEYLGLNGLFGDIISMLSLAELGFGTSIIFSLYKPVAHNDKEKVKSLMALYKKVYTVVGGIVIIAGLAITPFLGIFVKEMPQNIKYIEWIYILNILNAGASYFFIYKTSLLFTDQKKYIEVIISTIVKVFVSIFQIAVLYFTKNYFLFMIIMVCGTLTQNIIISIQTDKLYPYMKEKSILPLSVDDKTTLKKNVGASFFHKIGGFAVFGMDSIFIGKFVSVLAVGMYSNYILIRKTILNMVGLLFNSIASSMGNLNACETGEKKNTAFNNLYFFSSWLFGFMSICLLCLYNPFIKIWLGKEHLFDFDVVLLIVINFYLMCMRMPVANTKEAMGLFWQDRFKPLVEVPVKLAASYFLAINYGISGILMGTIISTVLLPLWIDPFVLYKHGLKRKFTDFLRRTLLYVTITCFACFITYYLCSLLNEGFLGFILKMIICVIVPNMIFLIVFHKTNEFKYLLGLAFGLIKKRLKRQKKQDKA